MFRNQGEREKGISLIHRFNKAKYKTLTTRSRRALWLGAASILILSGLLLAVPFFDIVTAANPSSGTISPSGPTAQSARRQRISTTAAVFFIQSWCG